MKREVFETVDSTSVPPGSSVMESKFHLVITNSGMENQTFKTRLVIFGNVDSQKNQILSEAPTVDQLSIIILISLSVIKSWPLWRRDVRQAFLQSESPLSRIVYMRPPRQLRKMFSGKLLRVIKPSTVLFKHQATGTIHT
jgi:hypothetical protein